MVVVAEASFFGDTLLTRGRVTPGYGRVDKGLVMTFNAERGRREGEFSDSRASNSSDRFRVYCL